MLLDCLASMSRYVDQPDGVGTETEFAEPDWAMTVVENAGADEASALDGGAADANLAAGGQEPADEAAAEQCGMALMAELDRQLQEHAAHEQQAAGAAANDMAAPPASSLPGSATQPVPPETAPRADATGRSKKAGTPATLRRTRATGDSSAKSRQPVAPAPAPAATATAPTSVPTPAFITSVEPQETSLTSTAPPPAGSAAATAAAELALFKSLLPEQGREVLRLIDDPHEVPRAARCAVPGVRVTGAVALVAQTNRAVVLAFLPDAETVDRLGEIERYAMRACVRACSWPSPWW
jgi:hypothetical protein